jgi:membrane associated rhomboid family serine protease
MESGPFQPPGESIADDHTIVEPPVVHPMVLYAILGLNLAVYTAWHTFGLDHPGVMRDHFMLSVDGILSGRIWTLLTSELSHIDATHLIINMIAIYSFGKSVERVIGSAGLVGLYLCGALTASAAHVLWDLLTGGGTFALGASGAAVAIAVVFGLWFPRKTVFLLFIPVPAGLAAVLFVVFDVLGLFVSNVDAFIVGPSVQIAHSAHLGGAVAGLVIGLAVLRAFGREGIALRLYLSSPVPPE